MTASPTNSRTKVFQKTGDSDGYEYNIRGRLLDEFIPRGSKVLIASHKSIMYLQEDYVICNYSTISTPTIDERLFQYWTLYPDKVPEYIV